MDSPANKSPMNSVWRFPIIGVVAAIAITSTMDASKLFLYSSLPLFPLMGLFWYIQRFSRQRIGFVWGKGMHYALAVLYPVCVIGCVTLISAIAGVIDISHTTWWKAWANLAITIVSTIL